MARPGALYPQVDPGAAGLMDRRVLRCAAHLPVARARALAAGAGAPALVVGPRSVVLPEDLDRAAGWGLDRLAVGHLAWDGLAVVGPSASEVAVRRLLLHGAPVVVVAQGLTVVGIIRAASAEWAQPGLSIAHRLEHSDGPAREASVWLLRHAGKVGEALGVAVWAVGGFVRDVLLERPALDLDLVVEGDGPAFARRLAEEIHGRTVVHGAFGTASVEGGVTAGGNPLPRIDVASARRERYRAPGALPSVAPAALGEDLARRDFSVNALAMALGPAVFGRLVDPLGAARDLDRRRLRVLHPLSFVEDPTRIFRAARYSARLALRLDAGTRRAMALALSAGVYPALSGQRLLAELELIVAEPGGWRALALLLEWGAFRLWDPGFRTSSRSMRRLTEVWRLCEWKGAPGILPPLIDAALVGLLLDQPPTVARRCVARLAITGARAERLLGAPALARRLARVLDASYRQASVVAHALRSAHPEALVAAWCAGGARARGRMRWFLTRGHAVRPLMTASDVIAAGVPRGPQVGRCLEALRDLRLDGRIKTLPQEQRVVERCRPDQKGGAT